AQFEIVSNLTDMRAVSKDNYNNRKYGKELAAAKLAETEAQLHKAMVTKEILTIKSPIDVQILSINIRPGESAQAATNLDPPLMRIRNTSTLHVRVEIDEASGSLIRPEAPAKAFLRNHSDDPIDLTYIRSEP